MKEALERLLRALDELGIRYFAVGSVASSVHGVARFTQDVDIVAELDDRRIGALANRLGSEFYMDAGEARSAVAAGRAFNLIHLRKAYKFDLFPLTSAFHANEMARSNEQEWRIPEESAVRLRVASAEDTVLSKLAWYRDGGEVSDRQWHDVLGIAARAELDWEYMREWAARLGVADLLERLKSEAGL